jgi:hypothetical protein
MKEGSSSFLKKRTKKLLSVWRADHSPNAFDGAVKQSKVFWFFFSKKNCFLPSTRNTHPAA